MEIIKSDAILSRGLTLYQCFDKIDNERQCVGNFILDTARDEFYLYLEHIYRVSKFRGYQLLPKVIDWIQKNFETEKITALPMEEYRPYFEKLGFVHFRTIGDDVYYAKETRCKFLLRSS